MENIKVSDIVKCTGGELISGDENTLILNISFDSRVMKGSDIFVPLIGARVDGHRFIDKAIENGAAAVFTSEDIAPFGDVAWIKVDDTLKALQMLGVYCKSRFDIPVVAVTGSVGKTTTREMVAQALSAGYKVFKTSKNFNSDIGLPVTLSEIKSDDEIAVLELGISDFGEMEVLTDMARPDLAIVTNIGYAHIAQFKTRDNTCKEKLSVVKGLSADGLLVLNGDDDMLKKYGREFFDNVIYYGLGSDNDMQALNIEYFEDKMCFDAVIKGKVVKVELPVIGEHMVMNALAALTAAWYFNVDLEAAAESLKDFAGFKNRQQIYDIDDIRVIDDTYNASPASMKAAISVLENMKTAGRKIAVLADMLELGDDSPRFHKEIGVFAASHKVDKLITVGSMGEKIADGFGEFAAENGSNYELASFKANAEAYEYLKRTVSKGDVLLFKGSNGMKLGEIINMLKEGK
ncbi:MAG: UDP-N-acetylmuramoyl-tripeptide--D-alanyl-D-alanine ligase [Lachnospiraceae bacterium]|nr:UDP-N-acetylmuramoyl-tripeptide--D-alanyl-D-alanine ligase [Lachnospiraceae bacterium]